MATSFEIVTEADASPERLFDLSSSIDDHVASMAHSDESAIAGRTSGLIGLDETVTWRARHFGVWLTMTVRITAWERPHRFVDEQIRGPFRIFRHEHTFESLAGSRSRMIDRVTIAAPILGFVVEPLILVPYLRRLISRRNAHLLAARRS